MKYKIISWRSSKNVDLLQLIVALFLNRVDSSSETSVHRKLNKVSRDFYCPINALSKLTSKFRYLQRRAVQQPYTMPIPFEGLLPYAIMTAFFGVAGHGVGFIRYWDNGWKNDRFDLDHWDEKMMHRDFLLTGIKRAQSSEPTAPEHFKTAELVRQEYWTPYRNQFFSLRERLYRGYVTGDWNFS